MSNIVIKKHNFVEAKEKIKKFLENLPQIETLQTVATTDEGFLFDSEHKVTGDELNKRLRAINGVFIKLNGLNIDIVREFRAVYEAFEFLDRDYVSSILCAIESAIKASDEALQASQEATEIGKRAKEISDNLDSVVDVLGKLSESNNERIEHLKTRLQSIKHLEGIDSLWEDVQGLRDTVGKQKTEIDKLYNDCDCILKMINSEVGRFDALLIKVSKRVEVFEKSKDYEEKLLKDSTEKIKCLDNKLQSINHLDEVDSTWNEVQCLKDIVGKQKTQIDMLRGQCADFTERVNVLCEWREEFEKEQEKRWKYTKIGAILIGGLWIVSMVFVIGKVG